MVKRRFPRLFAAIAALASLPVVASSATIYVSPNGTGDGSSWASPKALPAAFSVAAANDEIWLKEGDYSIADGLVSSAAITVRGGFAGTESDAAERAAGLRSVLYGGTNTISLIATSGTIELDGLVVSNATMRGIYKIGSASLTVKDCTICDNGPDAQAHGIGLYAEGNASSSTLVLDNLEFSRNRTGPGHAGAHPWNVIGHAAYVRNFKAASMTDCLFRENGLDPSYHNNIPGRETEWASIAYFEAAPVSATRCQFIGNRIGCHGNKNDRGGRIVALKGNCSGSVFDHCLWTGNAAVPFSSGNNIYGGMVYAYLGNAAHTVTLNGCTIAYNMAPTMSCAGLQIRQGSASVRDSIFYGNLMAADTSWGKGADIYISTATASVDIDYSLLAASDAPYLSYESGATVNIGGHMVYGDPLFATSLSDFTANVNGGTVTAPRVSAWNAYLADAFDGAALNLHLKSTTGRWNGSGWTQDASLSPAIDAADPSSAYANEPAPNGSCANIGFYGNSAEASKSSVVIPELDSVTIAQGDDYTRPTFTITTGGSNPYSASLTLYYTTTAPANANDPSSYADSVNVAFGVSFGETLHAATRQYFATGTTLYWLVTASNLNGSDSRNGSVILSGEAPPEYGKGGGAEVIHVWTGASGAADGSTWLDAVATLGEAALLVNASTGRTNIWIAGGLTLSSDGPDFDVPVSIRGGFTAIENTVGERPAGSSSALDGAATFRAMTLSATSGTTMLERLSVRNCLGPAVAKNGAGSLSLVDCEFTGNGNATSVRGAAVRAVGTTAASSLFVTNCVFKGNWCSAESGSGTYKTTRDHSGTGIYAESFNSVGLYDCAFTTNGPPAGNNSNSGRGSTFGGALRINNAPATVERCFFTGNRTCSHKDSTSGDTVWIEGNGSGTVFRNCAFIGNSSFYADANSNAGRAAGVGVNFGNAAHTALFENCTFAWNVGHKGNGGAIDAVKGAVSVVNSIFFGNSVNTNVLGYTGLDLYADTTATIALSHSMLASTDAPYCASATAGAITFGDGVITGDPLFMTESVEVATPLYAPEFTPSAASLNVHLRSKAGYTDETSGARVTAQGASPAIDAGAKGYAYSLEPEPNGHRINLGCYGNTPWASRSVANCTIIYLR